MMIAMVIAMVLLSLTLVARLAMRTDVAARIRMRMMFCAIPFRVVSGLRMNVMPSTIRKNAIINRFRMMMSTLFEMFSTFLMVLSKLGF